MPRIKIEFPDSFYFSISIPIRITDINYGGHVGNDTILMILHEARVQFLNHSGYGELNAAGPGLIMRDVAIEFKKELFYGDSIRVSVSAAEFSKASFDLYYKIEKVEGEKMFMVAAAKTGMVCYDYLNKKITAMPEEMKTKLGKSG